MCSIKKVALRNVPKFTGKQLHQSLFFNKVAEKEALTQCFPVNFAKVLRAPFLQNTFNRLKLSNAFTEIRCYKNYLILSPGFNKKHALQHPRYQKK